MIKIGSLARDKISGFTGIVGARTQWINGCRRVLIEPKSLKDDGSVLEGVWFDIQMVEVVSEDTGLIPDWEVKDPQQIRPEAVVGGPTPRPQFVKDPK